MAHLVELSGRLGRRMIFGLDDQLRRFEGIYAFSQDPDCVLRISRGISQREHTLADGRVVRLGDPVLELHWWNERIAGMPACDSGLHWGLQFYRYTYHSLIELARYLDRTPGLQEVVALHGETTFPSELSHRHHASAYRRLGFELKTLPPAADPWELVTVFCRHLHVWGLTWACNPASLRGKNPWKAVRSEVWISRHALLERCIGAEAPHVAVDAVNPQPITAGYPKPALSGATSSRMPRRLSTSDPKLSPASTDAWKLLRTYIRSHNSSWRR